MMDEIEIQKLFFYPVCNKDEIERIFNVQNAHDYLLKIRAETIVDHMRLFRVYRNKALADEKNWSLEKSFADLHYRTFLKNIDPKYFEKCKDVVAGNIFSNDPNGQIFVCEYGPIITISDSLTFFFKFMNLALLDFGERVPEYVCMNSLRIAIRIMLQTESMDFFMDPRGKVPVDIGAAIHNTIPYQMLFIAGHEYAHYLLDHISAQDISDKPIFYAILPGQEDYKPSKVYNKSQEQEFEADIQSILLPKYTEMDRKKIIDAALIWFGSLDLYEAVVDAISPPDPYGYKSHPSARDRYKHILENLPINLKKDYVKYKQFLSTIDFYKDMLLEDISRHIEIYEFYGSVYLDKPDSEWRGRELVDRIDYY